MRSVVPGAGSGQRSRSRIKGSDRVHFGIYQFARPSSRISVGTEQRADDRGVEDDHAQEADAPAAVPSLLGRLATGSRGPR